MTRFFILGRHARLTPGRRAARARRRGFRTDFPESRRLHFLFKWLKACCSKASLSRWFLIFSDYYALRHLNIF